jgi:2-deoxy-D-gluconate 3-dehydrogenase
VPLFALENRTILVTGAGRGLGRAMALAAVGAGATVVAVARSEDQLRETAALAERAGGRVFTLPWDLSDLHRADALVDQAGERAGALHGVVHAAGVQHRAPAIEVQVEDWERVATLNLAAPFFLSTALHRAAGAGSHVFVGSLTSHLGIANIGPYAASKSGLHGIVRTLAVEWASTGARANALAPGYFHTELTDALLADAERSAWIRSRIPMGRLGRPEDLAGTVVFLLSDASAYITGQMVNVDGGWTCA